MTQRLILHFDIADRQPELRNGVAPDDFVLARRDSPHPFAGGALAYCADMQSERVLYSLHAEALPALFDAPFLYPAQLAGAVGVVSVPFERLAELDADTPAARPTLVFSPGRTGSTLLARLLAAVGVPCASEPDMPTQICRFGREERMRIGLPMEVALQRAALLSLCRALGPAPFIKLRSQCNARPLPMLEAVSGAAAIFLLRRRRDWARSRHIAFGEPPRSIAAVLRQAIDALDKLWGAGVPFQVLWFEDLQRDPCGVLSACLGGTEVDASSVATIMAQDAQAGTAIARARLSGAAIDPSFDAAVEAAWSEARTGAHWSRSTQDILSLL